MKLRVTGPAGARVVVVAGDHAVIGRSPDCDVPLDDPGVSRRHAEVRRADGGWEVRDLGSRNGTFVNGAAVEHARVGAGDAIGLGPEVRVELIAEEAAEPDEAAADAVRPATERGAGGGNWLRPVRWRLRARSGAGEGIVLRAGATTVGRDAGAGLTIDDESVSRMHARLDVRGGELVLTDLKSRNGTHVNDHPVLQARLGSGDTVRFGDVTFVVERRAGFAWGRIAAMAAAVAGAVIVALVLGRVSDMIHERAAVAGTLKRMKQQAVEATRSGIAASRAGDPELARAYLIHAADLLLLADLAPRGATLDRPTEFFRGVAVELPAGEREFDFAKALDPATIASSEARLATLTNREYLTHQLRRYAVELNQDPNVPRGFEDQVWGFVQRYQDHPEDMRTMLRRARDLQPRIRSILSQRHLPEAFCYVAWAESALDPLQLSPAGALGLWQLMPQTARELGLQVVAPDQLASREGRRADQRTDVERSTAAAADYIAKLLRDQGPEYFMLVLASYNRGPGAIDRAKQKVDDPMLSGTRKFWYLSEHRLLPPETSDYVPKIMAIRLIAEAPQRFGFESP